MRKIRVTQRQFDMIAKCYRIGGFTLIFGVLAAFSFLINRIVEFAIMFLAYFISKQKYGVQYHAKSMKNCLLLSLVIFGLAVSLCLPRYYSAIFAGFVGLTAAYLSYHAGIIQFKLADYAYIAPRYNALIEKYTAFSVRTATAEEVKERCRLAKLNNSGTEFCLRAFTDYYGRHFTEKELAAHYCIELQSVKNKKAYYRKKLESDLL